jgi:hypothetical protein
MIVSVYNDLSLGDGAQGRNRTTDTVIFSHVLYQLSYLGASRRRGAAGAYRRWRCALSSLSGVVSVRAFRHQYAALETAMLGTVFCDKDRYHALRYRSSFRRFDLRGRRLPAGRAGRRR